MGAGLPIAAKVGLGLGGSLLSGLLNKPSGSQKAALGAQSEAAQAQAAEIRRQTQARRSLEQLIKSLDPLSGEAKNELIQLRPGKQTDFSGVRGTGDIDLLMQLAGLGTSSGALNSAAALAQQDIQQGRAATGDTVSSLVQLLLGLGGGNQLSPLGQGTLTGGFVPRINI